MRDFSLWRESTNADIIIDNCLANGFFFFLSSRIILFVLSFQDLVIASTCLGKQYLTCKSVSFSKYFFLITTGIFSLVVLSAINDGESKKEKKIICHNESELGKKKKKTIHYIKLETLLLFIYIYFTS